MTLEKYLNAYAVYIHIYIYNLKDKNTFFKNMKNKIGSKQL